MTPLEKGLAASSPTLALLLVALVWNGWEQRRRAVAWLRDWS